MRRRTLIATTVTAVLLSGSAMAGVSAASQSPPRVRAPGQPASVGSDALAKWPDHADWVEIKAAARMRHIGLAPHRTARFRAFAGYLGVSELSTIHPLAPGRCRQAVRALYGNLLDLENAQRGEHWTPLRRFVATEPSIRACAPR